jgi:hypothetical protein
MAEAQISEKKLEGLYKSWMSEIQNALEREKKYRQTGQMCVDLYEAKNPDDTPFAILYSNVEVLAPAVYNARPVPVVQRRYKDSDPLGKAVADVSTRSLKYLIDTESANYDGFDDLMQPAVLDGLLTNRGLTRFKFVGQEGPMSECVYGEAVRWDKFFHGYARTWKKVPWIGFEWDMTEAEIRSNFPDVAVDFRNMMDLSDDSKEPEPKDQLKGVKLAKVYEVWDKRTRKVYFFSACHTKGPLRMAEDPLGLLNFFPIPKPLNFMRKVTTLVPTPLYMHYKQQAQELNTITLRLKAIIKAIRFRGAYNSAVEGIEKMLNAEDNEMVPVENVQSMPDGTGMDKLLWVVPIQELAATAQSLYQQREGIKQVIYEITGISDILRGASVASETATAQNIKNQWGSLRLKRMQKEVQRYCRDALAIMLEIACNRFEMDTFKQMTGAPYMTEAEKQQVQMGLQQQQMQAQMAAQQQPPMQAPPGGPPMQQQPPAPPPAPEVPPEILNMLQQPSWEAIYGLMQNSVAVHYKTDIETNSTIDAEAAQDKQDIAELLNALSQFLNGLGPLVKDGTMPFEIAKEMLLTISRRYNFGMHLEDAIQAMKAPQAAGPDPAMQIKAETAKIEAQAKAQQTQLDMQLSQMEFQQKVKLMELEAQIAQMELQLRERELNLQMRAADQKLRIQEAQHRQKLEQIATQSAASEKAEKEPA